jgi:hypothetical protein
MVTITAPADSLKASLILVVWQGGRESARGSDLTNASITEADCSETFKA